jgi:hypothetical protein
LRPLWNLRLYRALKLAKIEALLSGIPLVGYARISLADLVN